MQSGLKVVSVLQILVASVFLLLTLFSFSPEKIWFVLLFGSWLLVAGALWQQWRFTLLLNVIFLIPVNALFLFQAYRRIAGLLNGMWRECPPAYFYGIIMEQMILIPALASLIVLVIRGRHWYSLTTKRG